MTIALKPLGADLPDQPLRSKGCEIIQGRSQRLSDTFQIGKRAHAGEYMRGIGALFAPCFEPAALLAALQQHLQQQCLGLPSHQDRKSTRLNSSHVEISYAV